MKKYIDISIIEDYVRQELDKVRDCADPFAAGKEIAYEEALEFIGKQETKGIRKVLEEWSDSPEGRVSYEKVSEEMREQIKEQQCLTQIEKIKAEIERREKIIRNCANQISNSEKKTYYSGCADALLVLSSFISSLQKEKQPLPHWIHANYSDKPEIRYTPSGIPYLQNGAYMIWLSDFGYASERWDRFDKFYSGAAGGVH